MVMLNIPIHDEATEKYIQELRENHQEETLQTDIEKYIKELMYKRKVLNGIDEAVKEVKAIENSKINEDNLETIDDFLAKYKQ